MGCCGGMLTSGTIISAYPITLFTFPLITNTIFFSVPTKYSKVSRNCSVSDWINDHSKSSDLNNTHNLISANKTSEDC